MKKKKHVHRWWYLGWQQVDEEDVGISTARVWECDKCLANKFFSYENHRIKAQRIL